MCDFSQAKQDSSCIDNAKGMQVWSPYNIPDEILMIASKARICRRVSQLQVVHENLGPQSNRGRNPLTLSAFHS